MIPDAKRVLAVGDSHNNVYLPAYETLAGEPGMAGRGRGTSWLLLERPP